MFNEFCAECLCNKCLRRMPEGNSGDCFNCDICMGTERDVVNECKEHYDIGPGAEYEHGVLKVC